MNIAFEAWADRARSVPIENELARRDIYLRGKGNERCGPCPKCGGDDRFSINIKKQVFNCRGCQVGGDVLDLVQHLDGATFMTAATTLTNEPPPLNGNANGHAPEPRKVRGEWFRYLDENGATLFGVRRVEFQNTDGSFVLKNGKRKKVFEQARRGPDGEVIFDVEGVRVIPYRLPELLEAIAHDRTVFIVEGEHKVEALAQWNVPAICNAAGAGKWKPEHSTFLRGADVVILPDNDYAGREHALKVAESLDGIAARIRVVELPGLPDKGDIVDWIAASHTREELDALVSAADQPGEETAKEEAAKREGPSLDSAKASSYSMRAVSWFWPGRFALGKLGLIGGLPDKGKGLISADIIARCTSTTESEWPCNEGKAPKGNVIWFTAEDDIEDTVVPRLVSAGADLDRVHIIGMANNPDGSPRMFNLATDLPLLLQKIEEIGDVVLVIIDPVSAYLGVGKVNNSSTTDVRGVLAPLTKLAEQQRISIIGIMHFNKKADVTNAMLRIADSLAYVAAARHVYVVVDDAENDKARLFVKAKNNLAADKHALRFMVGTRMVGNDPETHVEIWAPHVLWDDKHVEVTATEAMEAADSGGNARARRKEAEEFLRSKLSSGPVLQKDLEEEAKANCISDRTLRRAKTELNVKAVKQQGKVGGGWLWELPAVPKYGQE